MTGGTPDVEQHVETSPNGRYIRYNSVLGRGAYKTVYKAFDTEEALEVAWNKLHVDRLSEHDLEKVSNEVSLLRQVNHKNIIHFYDTWRGQDGNGNQTINFITEQMMSGTLKEYLRKAKAIKLKVIRRWCSNILLAIAYLHSQDPPIMHRDLKCDNIFINGHVGEVKIGDLGLSGVKERERAVSVIGTPEFMAPELYEESYTEKVDIYAFGMCLLEIVSMEYPYSECNHMSQIFKKVFGGEKPRAYNTLIDGDVKDVINACLQREARRPSALDLLNHPLFSEWEKDDGVKSNLSLVVGATEAVPNDKATTQSSQSMPIGTELIDWSDPLKRNVLVSMIEGEGVKDNQEVSVIATKENGSFYIGLEIPIRDAIKRVEFTFDPFEDSSQHIAHEMVAEFDLSAEQLSVIQQEIDLQVKIAKEQREAASRNATPQPAAKQGGAPSSSPSRPSRTDSEATSVVPSSDASQTSAPVHRSLNHNPSESLPTAAPERMHHHQISKEINHQQGIRQQQQPLQPHAQDPAQAVIQDHPTHEHPSTSELAASQGILDVAHAVQEGHSAHSLTPEELAQRSTTPPTVQPRVSAAMSHEVHQMQHFVRAPSTSQLPQREVTSSSQPQALTRGVDANVAMPGSQVSQPMPGRVRVQHVQPHATHQLDQQHAERTIHHPTSQVVHHTAVSQTSMHTATDGGRDAAKSNHTIEDGIFQEQVRTAPSGAEIPGGAALMQGGDSHAGTVHVERMNDSGPRMGSLEPPLPVMAGLSDSYASTQVPLENRVENLQEQEILPMRASHHGHEQQHQSLPRTESYVGSHAHSSASVETPSEVLSPTLPHEAQVTVVPFSQNASTGAMESTQPMTQAPPLENQRRRIPYRTAHGEEVLISTDSGSMSKVLRDTQVRPDERGLAAFSRAERGTSQEREQVMHRANSFPQQPTLGSVLSEGSVADHTRGQASMAAERLPQSASDEVLGMPSRVTVIDLAARPPSTPITPASPKRDSDEHMQASPPTMRNLLQSAGVEPMSQIRSVAVQGENHVSNSHPRTREFAEERSNVNVNLRPRHKSGSRPAIVVVSSTPVGSSNDSSRRGGAGRSRRPLSESIVGDMLPNTYSGANDFANRRLGSPERPFGMNLSNTQLGDFVRSEGSSQQPSPPGTDHLRTNSWMSLQSDETSGSTGVRDHASAAGARGIINGKHDQEWYTLNLKLLDFCARGIYEEVTKKLSQGASARFADYDKRTPLHLAATEGHVSVCVLLIENGADVNARDRWGQTPLASANEGRSTKVKELLIANGAIEESCRSVPVLSMELMQQTARGDLNAVREKIVAGAQVTFQDYDQRTPLHLACSEGHAEIAEVLLVNGASYSVKDRKERSPVDDAVTNGHRNVVRVLKQYGAIVPRHLFETEPDFFNQRGMDLLEHAGRGSVKGVSDCLNQGVSVNYGDYDHRTALHIACTEGRLEVVRLLLQAGADPHALDRWGTTSADEAQRAGFGAIMEDINRRDATRAQRQAPSVSFDQSVLMNGHATALHADEDIDSLSHGIATSVSMGAIPQMAGLADAFVGEYPSSSTHDPSSAGNSTSLSLPLTPFESAEDSARIGTRSNEDALLQSAFNARAREPEDSHGGELAEALHNKSAESLRSSLITPESVPLGPNPHHTPASPGIDVPLQDPTSSTRTRAISDLTEYGKVPNGNITRVDVRHSASTPRMFANTGTGALSSPQIAGATYLNEDGRAEVGSEMSGENPAIRNLVDGLIDAAISSHS